LQKSRVLVFEDRRTAVGSILTVSYFCVLHVKGDLRFKCTKGMRRYFLNYNQKRCDSESGDEKITGSVFKE